MAVLSGTQLGLASVLLVCRWEQPWELRMELPLDSLTAKGLENQECMWDYLLALRRVQLWG